MAPHASVTTLNDEKDRPAELGFTFAGVMAGLVKTAVESCDRLNWNAKAIPLRALLDTNANMPKTSDEPVERARKQRQLCNDLLKEATDPKKKDGKCIARKGIPQLHEIRHFIFDRLSPDGAWTIEVSNEDARCRFLRSVHQIWTSTKGKPDKGKCRLDGLPLAAAESIRCIDRALSDYDRAVILETFDVQELVAPSAGKKFVFSWTDKATRQTHVLKVTELVQDLKAFSEQLADSSNNLAALTTVADTFVHTLSSPHNHAGHKITKVMQSSFQLCVNMHSGPAYYTDIPMPDGLHLIIRTMEKVVNLWAILLLVLTGGESAATEALRGCEISGGYTDDANATRRGVRKFKFSNKKGKEYQKAMGKAANLAAPVADVGAGEADPDGPRYQLLIEMAFLFPLVMLRIMTDPDVEKTFSRFTREELGLFMRDFGLGLRAVYSILFDDKLLGVTSVTQLTVNVPQHFINGANTALAYGQVIESTVQEMKEWQRHLYNGEHRIFELMRRFWGSLYAEGENVSGIDRRVADILKHHTNSITEHNAHLDRAIVLVNDLKASLRADKAETVIDADKTLNQANVSERRAQKMWDDINYALDLTGDANMQKWNLWRHVSATGTRPSSAATPRVLRSAPEPAAAYTAVSMAPVPADFRSPYQHVEKLGLGTSKRKRTEIVKIAKQELADLEPSLQRPGVKNMPSVRSVGQLAYFGTTPGVKRDYCSKPYGPKIPAAATVPDTSDNDEALLHELFLTGDVNAPREEIDDAFGTQTIRLNSGPRRQGRRDMLRVRQEALRGTEIVAVPESTSAP
jgi:hypothetical protein